MEETVVPESHPVEVDNESLIDPVDEPVEETDGGVNFKICKDARQHVCRKYLKPVCNLVSSEQDPSSINEMHRVHKQGDIRCISYGFECPVCGRTFETTRNILKEIMNKNPAFQ